MSFYFCMILFFSVDTTVCNLLSHINGVNIRYRVTRYGTCTKTPISSKLVSLAEISVSGCLYQCIIRPNCVGLNYWRAFTLCDLISGNGVLERAGNCLYIKRGDIDAENTSCNELCDGEQICDEDGNCVLQENLECMYPDVPNGKPLGNMFAVGDRQVIQCDSGFSIHGSRKLKCMENKEWDNIPECWKDCDASIFQHADVEHFTNVSGSYAVVRCHEEYISNRTASRDDLITEETVGCAKNGSWIPNIDCIYIDNLLNVAWNKPATQSSTYSVAESGRATDGIWNPDYAAGSCTHTDVNVEDMAWWEVDLQQTYTIRRVIILNRLTDVAWKFKKVTVNIGNFSNPTGTCAVYDGPATNAEKSELECAEAITGQFVRLSKPNVAGSNNLAFCEIGIYEN